MEHEAEYLQQLKDEGNSVVEIPKGRNLQDRAQLTHEAMQSGADVIHQAVFFAALWRGDADFLIKYETSSGLHCSIASLHLVALLQPSQILEFEKKKKKKKKKKKNTLP